VKKLASVAAQHLPQPVEIPFPEQRAAVDAQIKFLAESEAASRKAKSLDSAKPGKVADYSYDY
jgi:hypothetical protein